MPQMTYVYDQSRPQRQGSTPHLLREQNNDDTYVEERWVEDGNGGIEMGNTEIRSSEQGSMANASAMMLMMLFLAIVMMCLYFQEHFLSVEEIQEEPDYEDVGRVVHNVVPRGGAEA